MNTEPSTIDTIMESLKGHDYTTQLRIIQFVSDWALQEANKVELDRRKKETELASKSEAK